MDIRSIETAGPLQGVTVLLRASLNVPLDNGVVRNRYRLAHALPTMQYLQAAGARTVVLGHIGRDPADTLVPVHEALSDDIAIQWGGAVTDSEFATMVGGLRDGDILLAENLRQDEREVHNDSEFAAYLASLGDLYVNDAFANLHREHASMTGIPHHLPAYAGLRVVAEVAALRHTTQPAHPSLFILGGAKFATKLGLVEQYLDIYDELFIGGALAHDILQARGYEIGRSLVSDVSLASVPWVHDARIIVPSDVVVCRADGQVMAVPIADVQADDTIYDCGPNTIAMLQARIMAAATVLWNGPLGNYEAGYSTGTEQIATALADSAAASYVGGGDTVAAIETVGRAHDFTFISTGGGAMLAFLEHGSLPALTPLLEFTD